MAFHFTTLFFCMNIFLTTCMALKSKELDLSMIQMAHNMVVQANNWAEFSAHDESSLIFGHHRHHRRHHGGSLGGGGGGGGGHDEDDDNLIFGHHHRHHGGGKGSGGGSGGGGRHGDLSDDTLTTDSHGGHHGGHHGVQNDDHDSTLDNNLIFGHHRHHRRHHGGNERGGGGGGGHDGEVTYNDTFTIDSHGGHHGTHDDKDDSTLDNNLIFGRRHHHRRHHGGRGGGGHDDDNDEVTNSNDTLTKENGEGAQHGDDSTLDNNLIFGRHRHHRRHHGGGGGGGYDDDDSLYNNTMFLGHHHHDDHHHGGHDDDDSIYDDSMIFGRGKHHGGGGGSGGHHGGHGGALLNSTYNETNNNINNNMYKNQRVALSDCARLYDQAKPLLARLLENESYTREDAVAWLSGALTSHITCLDGLNERGLDENDHPLAQNLTMVLNDALALHAKKITVVDNRGAPTKPIGDRYKGLLPSWNPATSRADIVVSKDGSGNYRTINEAVNALGRMANKGQGKRLVVHVKSGVYNENVEIGRNLRNVMFVGEGIDKTVVTGRRNYVDADTTVSSATFRVFGDGFWARDMTFENTAGPQKHQAVALMVASDNSLFYKCSIKGYQDTLYAHSLRQFYRDCKIYGTVDFIFGNAAVVFQNCDILVRRPMGHQANMITAQGRNSPYENTGISIHGSRILPAPELLPVKGSIKTFLGRPWKKYSRTVIAKTDIDSMIHPKGWTEWRGDFALSTLYYAEYMNTGPGASTQGRVNWPGYHVLRSPKEVGPFNVRNFIQGESWVMKTGVPVWTEI